MARAGFALGEMSQDGLRSLSLLLPWQAQGCGCWADRGWAGRSFPSLVVWQPGEAAFFHSHGSFSFAKWNKKPKTRSWIVEMGCSLEPALA